MTPACPNCNAILAPYGPKGYDGPSATMCDYQASNACPVDICSACAAFYEVDQAGDSTDWMDTTTQARCRPCELEREAMRGHNSADPRFA